MATELQNTLDSLKDGQEVFIISKCPHMKGVEFSTTVRRGEYKTKSGEYFYFSKIIKDKTGYFEHITTLNEVVCVRR
jgi:hypothetical protein